MFRVRDGASNGRSRDPLGTTRRRRDPGTVTGLKRFSRDGDLITGSDARAERSHVR